MSLAVNDVVQCVATVIHASIFPVLDCDTQVQGASHLQGLTSNHWYCCGLHIFVNLEPSTANWIFELSFQDAACILIFSSWSSCLQLLCVWTRQNVLLHALEFDAALFDGDIREILIEAFLMAFGYSRLEIRIEACGALYLVDASWIVTFLLKQSSKYWLGRVVKCLFQSTTWWNLRRMNSSGFAVMHLEWKGWCILVLVLISIYEPSSEFGWTKSPLFVSCIVHFHCFHSFEGGVPPDPAHIQICPCVVAGRWFHAGFWKFISKHVTVNTNNQAAMITPTYFAIIC